MSWTRGESRPRSSPGPAALARTFRRLEAHIDSLTTRSSRYQRPRRRYEDLCLATAVCLVQRDWLFSTTDSEWTTPGMKACLLAATKLELGRQTLELAGSRRWLSRHARRRAEARARERFETIASEIATEVPAEVLRAEIMPPPEPVPGNPGVTPHATYERARSARAAAVCASAVFVALAVVIGLTGLPFDSPGGDDGGPNPSGIAAAEGNVGAVEAKARPRAPAFETVAAADGRHAQAYPAETSGSWGVTEPLVLALAAWTVPAVAHDKDCSDFKNQKRAQRWLNQHHPHRDPFRLDSDHDGKACEGKPCPCSHYRPSRNRRARDAAADERGRGDVAAQTAPSQSTAAGTTGTVPVAAPPPPAPVSASALMPSALVTEPVRNVDRATTTAGVRTGLSQATGGLTGGFDPVGSAGDTVGGATGGLLGD
jgi:Excalibur calcium-binding domain